MGMVRRSKDWIISKTLKLMFKKFLSDLGELADASIDTETKRIHLRLELKGEFEPIDVTILKYEVDGSCFVIKEITTSREWMDIAIHKFNVPLKFEMEE
jgi:hypothetical protein